MVLYSYFVPPLCLSSILVFSLLFTVICFVLLASLAVLHWFTVICCRKTWITNFIIITNLLTNELSCWHVLVQNRHQGIANMIKTWDGSYSFSLYFEETNTYILISKTYSTWTTAVKTADTELNYTLGPILFVPDCSVSKWPTTPAATVAFCFDLAFFYIYIF